MQTQSETRAGKPQRLTHVHETLAHQSRPTILHKPPNAHQTTEGIHGMAHTFLLVVCFDRPWCGWRTVFGGCRVFIYMHWAASLVRVFTKGFLESTECFADLNIMGCVLRGRLIFKTERTPSTWGSEISACQCSQIMTSHVQSRTDR